MKICIYFQKTQENQSHKSKQVVLQIWGWSLMRSMSVQWVCVCSAAVPNASTWGNSSHIHFRCARCVHTASAKTWVYWVLYHSDEEKNQII